MCTEERDVLVIYDIPRKRIFLGADLVNAKDRILTLQESGIREGALVLIADYTQGDLFVTNQVIDRAIFHQNIGANATDTLTKLYKMQDKTEVVELQRMMYYLKPLNIQTKKLVYGLYRKDLLGAQPAQELIRGIRTFRIQYGIETGIEDAQNSQCIYKNATQMEECASSSDWPAVSSLKINMSIINEHTQQEEPFEFEIALRNTPLPF
jgi:hypothetical protein